MNRIAQRSVTPGDRPWPALLRLRWPLGGAVALAFALGQLVEALLLGRNGSGERLLFDVVWWGLLGGGAVWASLTWVSRQEQRHEVGLARALREQRELNRRLERANGHLALLSEANHRIAASAGLDEILDVALVFPQRLVRARAAALLLDDGAGAIETRTSGAPAEELARLRTATGVVAPSPDRRTPLLLDGAGDEATALVLPLHDGVAPVGWIELFPAPGVRPADDELTLLGTIAGEVAEAIVGARRRAREERALYELERAIAEERARIARDIHDGLAQALAFRRLRIDLWLEWIDSDPERLRAELAETKGLLREQIRELRRAIFALQPLPFDELGFLGGLGRYVVEFAGQHGWEVDVDVGRAPAGLAPELEAAIFRIVQEGLTNAAKHAGAARVAVGLDEIDGGLRVIVRDDGRGFDPGRQPDDGEAHFGLRQVRERLAALRGQLTILSRPGAGTELHAWIPLAAGRVGAEATRR